MGGILRDVLSNEEPVIFKKEIYATACLLGALLYQGLDYLNCQRNYSYLIAFAFIFIVRWIAEKYHLSLPRFAKDHNKNQEL